MSINELINSHEFTEYLLQRPVISAYQKNTVESLANKVILITGAGGSIGSEICRQLVRCHPKEVILLGHGENSIYTINKELNQLNETNVKITTEIQEIQDLTGIQRVMNFYKPDIVFHSAAHKHVPLMERNPYSAIKNNIIGTKNVAIAAGENKVESFVLISTDKAVAPTSVMGATKKIAELMIATLNKKYQTNFTTVRFGNVMASRGSVIPLFIEQIKMGQALTITDREMTRYFMSIEEAAGLVIKAGAMTKGGEIFVLDMGEPVKIMDIAHRLIDSFAKEQIKINYTGIRQGEKLHEALLEPDEMLQLKKIDNMFVGKARVDHSIITNDLFSNYNEYTSKELVTSLVQIANYNIQNMEGMNYVR